MKKIISILIVVASVIALFPLPFFVSCKELPKTSSVATFTVMPTDMVLKSKYDSLLFQCTLEKASIRDSCRILLYAQKQRFDVLVDSLGTEIQLKNTTIGAIRKYYKICVANPKNDVFLKGWIGRALSGD